MLELLVIQPTSLCNLDCSYCYVPNRLDAKRLDMRTLERLFGLLSLSSIVSSVSEVEVLWHAGEPLTVGLNFYKEAFSVIERCVGSRFKVKNTIQTNATLLTAQWCEFFLQHNVGVGISLDGPQSFQNTQRRKRDGSGSFEAAMRGIALLRDYSIPVSALCVLTVMSLNEPDAIFWFFANSGIHNLAFNVEETEGVNFRSSLVSYEQNRSVNLYSRFMTRLLQLNRSQGNPLEIREFHSLAQNMLRRKESTSYVTEVAEQKLGAILTMTKEGEITSWSPELASADENRFKQIVLGNVNGASSLDILLQSERAKQIQTEIDDGVAKCRAECKYFAICGGGSPSNKFFETDTFSSTKTLQCSLHIQALSEVIFRSLTN
jgi:uncharacterized protein